MSKAENFLDELEHTHIVLFHEGGKETKNAEYSFIKKGLDKQQHCFYTTQKPEKILDEMKEYGIDIEKKRELLHIVEIPEKFEDYSKIILDKVAELPENSEIRVISTHYFDFDSEDKTDRMAEIEQCVDDDFHKINGNFVCSFEVNQINESIRSRFLNQLLDSHKAVMFLRKEKGTDVFTLP
tara:strand:- start:46 stop:591 length:546 start_codon:yes stop_codon:yes gene_type:complete